MTERTPAPTVVQLSVKGKENALESRQFLLGTSKVEIARVPYPNKQTNNNFQCLSDVNSDHSCTFAKVIHLGWLRLSVQCRRMVVWHDETPKLELLADPLPNEEQENKKLLSESTPN